MGGFIGPSGSGGGGGGGGGGFEPTYALEYALVNGALHSGTEVAAHAINSRGSNVANSALVFTGTGLVTSPSAAIRGAYGVTSATSGGGVGITNAGPTATNADRSWEMVFRITDPRNQGYVALAQVGQFANAECFGVVRAAGALPATQQIVFQAGAGNAAGTGNVVTIYEDSSVVEDMWVYLLISYDASESLYTLWWRAEGDEDWSTTTLAFTGTGTGTTQLIRLGGDGGSFFAWRGEYAYGAIHDAALDTTYRDGMWSLLAL